MRCSWCGEKIKKDEKWVRVEVTNALHMELVPDTLNPAILHEETCLKKYESEVIDKLRQGEIPDV